MHTRPGQTDPPLSGSACGGPMVIVFLVRPPVQMPRGRGRPAWRAPATGGYDVAATLIDAAMFVSFSSAADSSSSVSESILAASSCPSCLAIVRAVP